MKLRKKTMELIERLIDGEFITADEFDDFAMFRIETFFEFINSVELAVMR